MHDYTLKELLLALSNEEFAWLADYYGILWDKTSQTRTRAITGIARQLLDVAQLFDEAVLLDSAQWAQFMRIKDMPEMLPSGDAPPYLHAMLELGYLFNVRIGDGDFLVMPREVKRMLESEDWRRIEQERADTSELFLSATAAVNLYGVIEMGEFVELYNSLFGRHLKVEEAVDMLVDFDMNEVSVFVLWRDYLVHVAFEEEDFEGVLDLLSRIQGKPRYIPGRQLFLQHAQPYYTEQNLSEDRMLSFLRENLKIEEQEAKILLIELHMLCASDNSTGQLQQALELLGEGGVVFGARDDVNVFTDLFSEMMNNTRIWHNKGYTPNEMLNIVSNGNSMYARTTERPDRNAPCSCGSGKPYRECCGKKDNIIKFPGPRK